MNEWIVRFDKEQGEDVAVGELIRCKDCVHFKRSEVLGNTCALMDNHVTKKDYCSKAERKENGK